MVDSRPDLVPREAFAERFSLLYAQAGDPPLKQVANAVARAGRVDERGQPVRVVPQRVSDWRRGRNVPARFAALAIVLEVLIGHARRLHPKPPVDGLYDLAAWRKLWREALATPVSAATEPGGDTGVCPYRGLSAFRTEDTRWFFGQERSRDSLIARLADAMGTGGIVALVGASGAGKSSLVHAGLVPALGRGVLSAPAAQGWPVVVITPGDEPVKQLNAEIPGLAEASGPDEIRAAVAAEAERRGGAGARLVLVVDQFEEMFTLCDDEEERRRFVLALEALCARGGAGLVLVVVRADFYSQCLEHPPLAEALQARAMVLGPMTTTELRDTVTAPAKAAGLQLEPGLVDLILRDLGVQSGRKGTYNAGALPLLSHALLVTWQRRQSGKLTIAGYRAAGGIQRAVAETAERAWAALDPVGQNAARQILLRLVRVGEDTQDTRRRCDREELMAQATHPAATERALDALASARLLTLDADRVEITHEALLHAWPRLRRWIDQDRAGNLLRQRLEEDARAWDQEGRDSSPLYRGARLENAQQWAMTAGPDAISPVAREFLNQSVRHQRRNSWLGRAAVAMVVVFALVAVSAAFVAVKQRDDARFQQVVAEADRLSDSDPSLSALLNLAAYRMRPDDSGVATRLISTQQEALATPMIGHTGAVYLTSFSPDGNVLASASDDGTALLWDVTDPARPTRIGDPISGNDGTIYLVAFSPDGRMLATATEGQLVRLWDIADPRQPAALGELTGHTMAVRSVAFSPDGHTLAAGSDDSTILLWDVTDPRAPAPLGGPVTGFTDTVHSVAFSPDGNLLAAGSSDKTVRLWNVVDRAAPVPLGPPLIGHTAQVWSVAFSPDGHTLASTGSDGTARLWNLTNPAKASELEHPLAGGAGFAVSFSPDGRSVATGGQDGIVRLWSLPTTVVTGHSDDVGVVAFSRDGHLMATGSNDRTVRLWSVQGAARPEPLASLFTGSQIWSLEFNPDARVLAASGADHTVQLWDVSDPAHAVRIGEPLVLGVRYANHVTFSPDGKTLATGHDDQSAQLWDISDPAHPTRLGDPLTGHTGYVNSMAFSPDGKTLATASSDQTVRLWDVTNPARAVPLGEPLTGHTGAVNAVQFDRDGDTLATGSDDKSVRLWEVGDPAHAAPLGAPLTGFTGLVRTVSFNPDGECLAATADDGTILLWDVSNPAKAVQYGGPLTGGPYGTVNSAAFGVDGILATTSASDTVLLWDLDVDHAVERICGSTRGVLTEGRWQQHLGRLPYDPPCPDPAAAG